MERDSRGLILTRYTEFIVFGQMQTDTAAKLDDEVAVALATEHLIPMGRDWVASNEVADLRSHKDKLVATHGFYARLFNEGILSEEEYERLVACAKDMLRHVLVEMDIPIPIQLPSNSS